MIAKTKIPPNLSTGLDLGERGLTISGTRLTLYDVMDFLKAEYSLKLIRHKFNLTDDQINAVLSYIEQSTSPDGVTGIDIIRPASASPNELTLVKSASPQPVSPHF
jgi:hypothetical protein